MTREEQIEITSLAYGYVGSGIDFEAGAKWADANLKSGLIDLSQVWHNSKEEPEKGKSIISIGETGVSAYKWVDEWRCDWLDFAEWSELIGWAYADDLLPKGGKLCKNKF